MVSPRSYRECDSYECIGCPRESDCDMKEDMDLQDEPAADMVGAIVYELVERVDRIDAQMQALQSTWDDMWATILKARVGDGG